MRGGRAWRRLQLPASRVVRVWVEGAAASTVRAAVDDGRAVSLRPRASDASGALFELTLPSDEGVLTVTAEGSPARAQSTRFTASRASPARRARARPRRHCRDAESVDAHSTQLGSLPTPGRSALAADPPGTVTVGSFSGLRMA